MDYTCGQAAAANHGPGASWGEVLSLQTWICNQLVKLTYTTPTRKRSHTHLLSLQVIYSVDTFIKVASLVTFVLCFANYFCLPRKGGGGCTLARVILFLRLSHYPLTLGWVFIRVCSAISRHSHPNPRRDSALAIFEIGTRLAATALRLGLYHGHAKSFTSSTLLSEVLRGPSLKRIGTRVCDEGMNPEGLISRSVLLTIRSH